MKTWKAVVVLAVMAAALLLAPRAAFADSFTSIPFEPVFKGMPLETPVNLDKLRPAIRMALTHFNWRILSDAEGAVTAEYVKTGQTGIKRAEIKVVYDSSGYRIEYVTSQGLDADLTKMKIHKNFVRWMRNLDKQIYMNYYL